MNESVSHDLRPPNAMNNLGLWMKLKTLSREVRALDAIKSSEL